MNKWKTTVDIHQKKLKTLREDSIGERKVTTKLSNERKESPEMKRNLSKASKIQFEITAGLKREVQKKHKEQSDSESNDFTNKENIQLGNQKGKEEEVQCPPGVDDLIDYINRVFEKNYTKSK